MGSSKRAKLHLITSRLLWLALVGVFAGYWLALQFMPLTRSNGHRMVVTVKRGDSVSTLARTLVDNRVVRSKYAVYLAAMLAPKQLIRHLQPGEYYVSTSQTAGDILDEIGNGRMASVRVTFPEGFTLNQIAERLQEHRLVNADAFIDEASHDGLAYGCQDGFTPGTMNLEGFLFPDEYDFGPDSTVHSVILEMLERFDAKVVKKHPDVVDWRDSVTVASMVERETSVPSERPMIAGVIDNRLKLGMPLQIDATVQYALPRHKDRLMYSDLKVQSSYNTYLHKGLPPSAICSPGVPSIEAALQPAHVPYLYYVEGADGKHLFGKTFAQQEHNIALGKRGRAVTD